MANLYQQVYDYARAYEDVAWGMASVHAWDRLDAIAGEYHRGEITWERAKALIDDTLEELS